MCTTIVVLFSYFVWWCSHCPCHHGLFKLSINHQEHVSCTSKLQVISTRHIATVLLTLYCPRVTLILLCLTPDDFTLTPDDFTLTPDDFTLTPDDFTLSNARRFYSSKGGPSGSKGLRKQKTKG